jgi:amino acid permease
MVLLVPYLDAIGGDTLAVVGAIVAIFFLGNIVEAIMFAKEAKKLFSIKFEYKNLLMLYLSNLAVAVLLAGLLVVMNNFIVVSSLSLKYVIEMIITFVVLILIYPFILLEFRAMSRHDIKSMRHATMRLGKVSGILATFFDYSEFISNILRSA